MHSPQPAAYAQRQICLRDGVSRDTFEKFMLETLFPTVDTSRDVDALGGEDLRPDEHRLLQAEWPSTVYVWLSRIEYSVHQTPFPAWLFSRLDQMYEQAREPLAPFGAYVSEERRVSYDVASMGGMFS
jgi:hypothetical protein